MFILLTQGKLIANNKFYIKKEKVYKTNQFSIIMSYMYRLENLSIYTAHLCTKREIEHQIHPWWIWNGNVVLNYVRVKAEQMISVTEY